MSDPLHERLYRRGFLPGDFKADRLAPNLIVLRPLRRPEIMGGILTAGEESRFESLAFVVVAASETVANASVGDTVCIRNALAEPVQPDRQLYIVDAKHVWAVLERAAETVERLSAGAKAELEAKAEIQKAREALVRF